MLEPDATQEGGLDQAAVMALITNAKIDMFNLHIKWADWRDEGELIRDTAGNLSENAVAGSCIAFNHAADESEVRAGLFDIEPVEWNRLPHFQDVTVRLIAERGILQGKKGELYLQGEAAMGKVCLPAPLNGRKYHLFFSEFNEGAEALAEALKQSSVFESKGKKVSAPLTFTSSLEALKADECDHMLVLLDERTWTSGDDTAAFVEHIHDAMRTGVHILCVHEFPAVVGPTRFECEFDYMFRDDWTPAHLTGGETNLYKEIALALKGDAWRLPGFVAFASKLASSAGEHKRINFTVPISYQAKAGPNPWRGSALEDAQPLPLHVAVPMEVGGDNRNGSRAPPEPEDAGHAPEERATTGAAAAMVAPPPKPAPKPMPLVTADPVNERGSLMLEDGATFLPAVAANSTGQVNPQEDAGLMQNVTTRLKGFLFSSNSAPADSGAGTSNVPAPAAPALEADHADLHA